MKLNYTSRRISDKIKIKISISADIRSFFNQRHQKNYSTCPMLWLISKIYIC